MCCINRLKSGYIAIQTDRDHFKNTFYSIRFYGEVSFSFSDSVEESACRHAMSHVGDGMHDMGTFIQLILNTGRIIGTF